MGFAEYIWLDGSRPTQKLRGKTRFVDLAGPNVEAADFPEWSFDGSSTGQADGSDSDCALKPVCAVSDPIRGSGNFLVLCEVENADGSDHPTNSRAELRAILAAGGSQRNAWVGFEQEYTLFSDGRPLGFPASGFPETQGKYYCGVGADRAFGRQIAEEHAELCLQAGLMYFGLNGEVMPGQWEFQIGYRGVDREDAGLLNVSDHLWIARYLLDRVAERHGVLVSFDNKPMKGDWNGAGMHTNFSCSKTRGQGGIDAIYEAIRRLAHRHEEHIAVYGDGLEERLTGEHETCSIKEFRAGGADRGASVRVPLSVERAGAGYFEDRRPGANACPYRVAARIAATVFGIEFDERSRMALVV